MTVVERPMAVYCCLPFAVVNERGETVAVFMVREDAQRFAEVMR